MGEPNVVTKNYMQDNARFADACNFYLFHGEQVIKPEDLTERDVTELALPKGLKGAAAIEKIRDVLKGCCVKTANGVTYLIIGIENQTDVHYAMVVRNMLYDAMNYSSQVEACAKKHHQKKDVSGAEYLSGFAKSDMLHPVVTLTIFWNYGGWDGARSLHEMMDVKDNHILDYVSDYKLNLIVPEEITNFDKFKTELGPLLEFISCASSGESLENALEEKKDRWTVLNNEEIALLNACLDAKLEMIEDTEEGVDNKVCRGIEEYAAKRKAEGKAEGRAEGRAEGVLNTLLDLVRDGLLSVSVAAERAKMSEEEFQKQL